MHPELAWIFYLNEFNYLSYYYLWLNKHHNTHIPHLQCEFPNIQKKKDEEEHKGAPPSSHWIHFHETYEFYACERERGVSEWGVFITHFDFHRTHVI